MRAIVLDSFGEASQFRLADIPTPAPKEHEVRIKIKAIGFNPVDFKMRKGSYGGSLPVVLGADCAGVIDSVGKAVKEFQVGDEVMAFVFGQGSNGTYAESVCIACSFVAKKPKKLSFEEAAAVPLVGLTAYRALESIASVKKNSSIFIAGGGGGVGSIAIQLARALGPFRIVTMAGGQESMDYLTNNLKLPRENILNYQGLTAEQKKEKLIAINKGEPFAAAFDFVGNEEKKLCFSVVDFQGHVVSIVPEAPGFTFDLWTRGESIAFAKNLSVHFIFVGAESFGGSYKNWAIYKRQLDHLSSLLESGDLVLPSPRNMGPFSVETVQKAHSELESARVKGKLIMTVSEK